MSDKSELYMATSIEELKEMTKANNIKVPTARIVTILKDIFMVGNSAYCNGDEETAFIQYSLLLNHINTLESSHKCHSQYDAVLIMLNGTGGLGKLMRVVDELEHNLNIRYEKKRISSKIERGVKSGILVDPFNVIKTEPSKRGTPCLNLDCFDFHNLLKKRLSNFLILDCRLLVQYVMSCIQHPAVLNVPPKLLKKYVTVDRIIQEFNDEEKKLWMSLPSKETIILMDSSSTFLAPNTPIYYLKCLLNSKDIPPTTKIYLLVGGYQYFKLLYPDDCYNHEQEEKSDTEDHKTSFVRCMRNKIEKRDSNKIKDDEGESAQTKRWKPTENYNSLKTSQMLGKKLSELEKKSQEIVMDYNLLQKKQLEFIHEANEVTSLIRDQLQDKIN